MIDAFGDWLRMLPADAVMVIALLAFLESCPVIGFFFSGIFLLGTVTVIYIQSDFGLMLLVSLAFVGAMIGDHLGYYVGRFATPLLWKKRWVRKFVVKRKEGFRRARQILMKSAPHAVLAGRLTPPVRSLSPLVVGSSGVGLMRFFLYDLMACSVWASLLAFLVYTAEKVGG